MKNIKKSAGILLYRLTDGKLQFFLVHPGGPFWAKKDIGAWSIPKGEFTNEQPLEAAKREFAEETSFVMPEGDEKLIPLTPVTLKSGKIIYAWAALGDVAAAEIKSNVFNMEWPPKSGKTISVPEVDKGGWFSASEAKEKINIAQAALIDEAVQLIG